MGDGVADEPATLPKPAPADLEPDQGRRGATQNRTSVPSADFAEISRPPGRSPPTSPYGGRRHRFVPESLRKNLRRPPGLRHPGARSLRRGVAVAARDPFPRPCPQIARKSVTNRYDPPRYNVRTAHKPRVVDRRVFSVAGKLSDREHDLMDGYLGQIFEEVRSEDLGKTDFIEAIALVMTAIDMGERAEALRLFEDGARRSRTPLGPLSDRDFEARTDAASDGHHSAPKCPRARPRDKLVHTASNKTIDASWRVPRRRTALPCRNRRPAQAPDRA